MHNTLLLALGGVRVCQDIHGGLRGRGEKFLKILID